jgi:hypothetical protein
VNNRGSAYIGSLTGSALDGRCGVTLAVTVNGWLSLRTRQAPKVLPSKKGTAVNAGPRHISIFVLDVFDLAMRLDRRE